MVGHAFKFMSLALRQLCSHADTVGTYKVTLWSWARVWIITAEALQEQNNTSANYYRLHINQISTAPISQAKPDSEARCLNFSSGSCRTLQTLTPCPLLHSHTSWMFQKLPLEGFRKNYSLRLKRFGFQNVWWAQVKGKTCILRICPWYHFCSLDLIASLHQIIAHELTVWLHIRLMPERWFRNCPNRVGEYFGIFMSGEINTYITNQIAGLLRQSQ